MANELSIELSYEEIKDVILKCGFQLEVRQADRLRVSTWYDCPCASINFFPPPVLLGREGVYAVDVYGERELHAQVLVRLCVFRGAETHADADANGAFALRHPKL